MPDEPGAGGEQGDLVSRLRAVIGAKDEQIAALTAALEASLERERRLGLRLAEVERRLSMDSSDSGTPSSKERIGAKEARRARQQSERERSRDRKRGGQPGHEGKGLLGIEVSAGWVDKAAARVNAQLGKAGFGEAMLAALAGQDVLAADETPVNVLDGSAPAAAPEDKDEPDPEEKDGKAGAGAPHVLITRTPDGRLTFLQAIGSRRKSSVAAAVPASFTGYLITDGYAGYQHLLSRLAGIQQCAQHVIRRCRAVTKLGPGSLQSWAADIITILRDAHAAVGEARARGDTALDRQVLDDLLERYDTAAAFGRTHNRLRDWDTGNHPGYAFGCWLE